MDSTSNENVELLKIAAAAERWWESHRPLGWSVKQHLDNPMVNLSGQDERDLAQSVVARISSSAKIIDNRKA